MSRMNKISLQQKFSLFDEHWSPKIVAELNGQHVKIAKLQGELEWHQHADEDELFWVVKGKLKIELRDQTVELSPGEIFVVPRGVEHKPSATEETHIVMFEPAGTLNTGDAESDRTVASPERI